MSNTKQTTLFDFCNFIEKELKITLTNEQWKIYREKKESSLNGERADLEDAFVSGSERGTNNIPFNCEQYFIQTFKND